MGSWLIRMPIQCLIQAIRLKIRDSGTKIVCFGGTGVEVVMQVDKSIGHI